MKITKLQLKNIIKQELKSALNEAEEDEMPWEPARVPGRPTGGGDDRYDGDTAEEETHRNRVQQGSGVLSSKMAALVGAAYKLADSLELGRDETREVLMAAGEELQTMTSPSDNPVTKLVIEQLKFLVQPGVLITEIGQAMTAFDE